MSLSDLLPDENYLFDLKIRTEGVGNRAVSSMEVVPEVLGDRGALHAGLLLTLIDAVTGRIAMRAAHPDVVATTTALLESPGR